MAKQIGPRMANGMFTKNRKARKARAVAKSLTKNQKAEVKKIVLGPKSLEKYCGVNLCVQQGLSPSFASNVVLNNAFAPTNWTTMLPDLGQGAQGNERIGDRIDNIRGHVDLQFNLGITDQNASDVMVAIFECKSRSAKSVDALDGLHAGTLLDNGADGTNDWNASVFQPNLLNQRILSRDDWTGKKHVIRLVKNNGLTNASNATAQFVPNTLAGVVTRRIKFSHKATVRYDATPGSKQPTNYLPLFACVWWYADGSPTTSSPVVYLTATTHMFFKDVQA